MDQRRETGALFCLTLVPFSPALISVGPVVSECLRCSLVHGEHMLLLTAASPAPPAELPAPGEPANPAARTRSEKTSQLLPLPQSLRSKNASRFWLSAAGFPLSCFPFFLK